MPNPHSRAVPALLSAVCLLWTAPAHAQDNLFDIDEDEVDTFLDVGGVLLTRPGYVGSEEARTNVLPYLAFEYEGRYFGNAAEGLGVNLIHRNGLRLAPVAYFAAGRDAEDTPFFSDELDDTLAPETADAFKDAFDVDGAVTVGGLASYLLPFARLDLQGQVPVTGDLDGWRGDISATTLLPFFGDRITVAPGARATYTSAGWAGSYYDLDLDQAALAGLPEFDTDGGFNSYSLYLLGQGKVTDTLTVVGALNWTNLTQDAKDSPLSPDNNGLTALVGVARRF